MNSLHSSHIVQSAN